MVFYGENTPSFCWVGEMRGLGFTVMKFLPRSPQPTLNDAFFQHVLWAAVGAKFLTSAAYNDRARYVKSNKQIEP